MYIFGPQIVMSDISESSANANGSVPTSKPSACVDNDIDEEWSTPLAKISRLYYDHESWSYAKEILETPSAACRKVGDEARSIVARHIIDRIRERQYLDKIHSVAPRLRSAVELLSKPDADYVYPPFRFVLTQMLEKHPQVYTSVVKTVDLRIPIDMKPTTMLVSMAKYVLEDSQGNININWGKFTSLLCLSGALAMDSIEAGYPEGVVHVVDTFGLIVEQVMGEWILSPSGGNGWVGFIKQNQYEPLLRPIPRTIVILIIIAFLLYCVSYLFYLLVTKSVMLFYWATVSPEVVFWKKWGNVYSDATCTMEFRYPYKNILPLYDIDSTYYFLQIQSVCPNPASVMEALYSKYIYAYA